MGLTKCETCVSETAESEGKGATNTLTEDRSVHEGEFSEVYDWRPSVEKTDVMRTMEAIEGEHFP